MLLERLAANQREIEKYLKRQEEFFYKLEGDVKNNRLRKGIEKEEILSLLKKLELFSHTTGGGGFNGKKNDEKNGINMFAARACSGD
jgi:hypothetical protein